VPAQPVDATPFYLAVLPVACFIRLDYKAPEMSYRKRPP
jgi:hypothetical protein